MKRVLVVAALVGGSLGVFAGSAHAGEITGPSGNGKPTQGRETFAEPLKAHSACAFSGLNDDPNAPLTLDLEIAPNGPGGQSQSYGQDVKLGLSPQEFNPASPGACNPNRPGTLPGT
jgi:hypothetical protein